MFSSSMFSSAMVYEVDHYPTASGIAQAELRKRNCASGIAH